MTDVNEQDSNTDDEQDSHVTITESTTKEPDSKVTGFDALPDETKAEIKRLRRENAGYRKDVETIKTEKKDRDEAKAKEDGRFEDLLKERENELNDLKSELADRDLNDLKRSVATKHGIPDDLVDRLHGDTEETLTEDALKLAKLVIARQAPETDADRRTNPKTPTKKQGDTLTSYEFGKRSF